MADSIKTHFILASASARRKDLLERAGYKFDVVVSGVDESAYPDDIDPKEYAKILAMAKAKNVGQKFPDRLVLGADTIADFNGNIIGKADDAKHAEEIIQKLFSMAHKIITAVALVKIDAGLELVETDTTVVYPRQMSAEQIDSYIKSGVWKGKAGAYGIQETGDEFIEKIDGSFTNVMGLPMELTEKLLKKHIR